MEYKKMAIGKFSYGDSNVQVTDCVEKDVTNFNFYDENISKHLIDKSHENYDFIERFMTHLAICHTVVSEVKNGKTIYNASSPDELALVNAAKYFGYKFLGRDDDNNIEVSINGKSIAFTLMNVIEFSSDR
jgi:phospholipid-transporting ATPase